GKGGSTVRLGVLSAEGPAQPQTFTFVREKIKLEDQSATKKVVTLNGQKVGVIQLPTFYLDFEARRAGDANAKSATHDVERLLKELKAEGVQSVLVDLRGNGGGSLTEAVELTGLFIDSGPVVQVRSSGGKVEVEGDLNRGVAWEGPMAVLVDRNSASASEIFAAAIQDHGRGLVVGENTFGKGTVQTLVNLDDFARVQGAQLGQVKLTVAQFFRIDGHTTQRDGVKPDVFFPLTVDGDEAGESSLKNALAPSTIDPARYNRLANLAALKAPLQAAHDKRMATDPQLRWWMDDVRQFRQERGRKVVSLNEAERRASIDQRKAELARRDDERRRLGLAVNTRHDDDGLYAYERTLKEQVREEEESKKG
ncbi:MAG: tail-specific protease, partial [Sphingomonas sp.]